jgi:DNA methyltransferase 1-associated protein 1
MADVLDILELGRPGTPEVTKESIMGTQKPKPKYKPKNEVLRKPEGMARELFNLLVNDSKDAAPLFPTDTGNKPCILLPICVIPVKTQIINVSFDLFPCR